MLSFETIRNEKQRNYKKEPSHTFYKAFEKRGTFGIIAEFKRRSPSQGELASSQDSLESVIKDYENAGATALSILTDPTYFNGSIDDLVEARRKTKLPILRKDFICLSKQICESALYGADCVLLISEMLDESEIEKLGTLAYELELDLLVEIHELGSYEKVKRLKVPYILGVNTRNLKTLSISHQHALEVVKNLPTDVPLIIESGIETIQDIQLYAPYRPSGFLIGTSLMKSTNRYEKLSQLVQFTKDLAKG
ncbi:indole-3-glycerol-phosphate synthase [Fervidobacterium pennivorans subsp. carthaginiensis]|uniref:indole-3-glycerol-phosphate synthase n=1 Tax=Fervidobacterium pennivorans TaxID=93466 RepID=UPI00355BEDD7